MSSDRIGPIGTMALMAISSYDPLAWTKIPTAEVSGKAAVVDASQGVFDVDGNHVRRGRLGALIRILHKGQPSSTVAFCPYRQETG